MSSSPLGEKIKPIVADVTHALNLLKEQGANVLFEGAQGAMLDVDHGTYPYVTSSNTTAGFAATGHGARAACVRRSARHRQGVYHSRGRWAVPDQSSSMTRASISRASGTSSAR